MRSMNSRIALGAVLLLIVGLMLTLNRESPELPQSSEGQANSENLSNAATPSTVVAEAIYPVPRTVRYRFLATNRTGEMLKGVKLTMFSPLLATSSQKTVKLDVSHEFRVIDDKIGNRLIEFEFDRLPPYATQVISVEAQLMMADQPQPMSEESIDIYLRNGPLLDLDNPETRDLAETLRRDDTTATAKAIYDWVDNNLEYSGYIASDRGASYAMLTRQGDCTEYAYLLSALARINGIPARIMAGFVYANNAILRPYDYHNWVELYIDGRWHIADPLNDMFFQPKASHVALRVLGGEGQLQHLGSQKGIESDPRIEVKME